MSDSEKDIYELESTGPDQCPSCGADWPDEDAVVCMKCGYNLRTNEKLKHARTDEKPVEIEAPPPTPELVHRGVVAPEYLLGAAAIIGVIGAILGGVIPATAETDAGYSVGRFFAFLLFAVGAGVLGAPALIASARITETKVGDLLAGTARVALASSLTVLAWSMPVRFTLWWLVFPIIAIAVYAVAMRIGFRKAPQTPRRVLAATHFLMMITLTILLALL